jgi:hypothetical protein
LCNCTQPQARFEFHMRRANYAHMGTSNMNFRLVLSYLTDLPSASCAVLRGATACTPRLTCFNTSRHYCPIKHLLEHVRQTLFSNANMCVNMLNLSRAFTSALGSALISLRDCILMHLHEFMMIFSGALFWRSSFLQGCRVHSYFSRKPSAQYAFN